MAIYSIPTLSPQTNIEIKLCEPDMHVIPPYPPVGDHLNHCRTDLFRARLQPGLGKIIEMEWSPQDSPQPSGHQAAKMSEWLDHSHRSGGRHQMIGLAEIAEWLYQNVAGNLVASVITVVIALIWHDRRTKRLVGRAHQRVDEIWDRLDGPKHHHEIHEYHDDDSQ